MKVDPELIKTTFLGKTFYSFSCWQNGHITPLDSEIVELSFNNKKELKLLVIKNLHYLYTIIGHTTKKEYNSINKLGTDTSRENYKIKHYLPNELYYFKYITVYFMKNLEKRLLEILPTHYGKPATSKVEELLMKGSTRFTKSSPGEWRHEAEYYHLKKNKLFVFETEWHGDLKTMQKFFETGQTRSSRYHKIYYINPKQD